MYIPELGLFQWARALYYLRFCDTSQEFQPMASQLSKKATLPLAKILATCRNNVSNTRPSTVKLLHSYRLARQDCNILTIQPSCEINSLAPGRFQRNFVKVVFQLILVIDG